LAWPRGKSQLSATLALTLVLAGCGSAATSSNSPASFGTSIPSGFTSARPDPSSRATARVTAAPLNPVNRAALEGTGSKVGPAVVLAGDYVLKDSVKAKAGCHWALYLDGLDPEPWDEFTTDAPGGHSTSTDEIGLDLSEYQLRVVASKCGAWTVSLSRP
jgi:hypothetical protein